MYIKPLVTNKISPSFTAGKTSFYTDFDGTFLVQPLHDLYGSDVAKKKAGVEGFNRYFAQFQDFIEKTKGKFEVVITTGRRLFGDRQEGFEHTYEEITKKGVRLPKIKSLITTSGGDIHHFNPDGTISHIADPKKALAVEQACGWNGVRIKSALDEAANRSGTAYCLVDPRGSYKLSVHVQDQTRVDEFYAQLKALLDEKVRINHNTDVRIYNGDSYTLARGIKLEPLINGHRLHKDFDVKLALKNAIKSHDFVIVAGDADNDKEALNLFSYIKLPKGLKRPTTVEQITSEHIKAANEGARRLPLKIFFIRPDGVELSRDKNIPKLYEFMQEQERLFPSKVKIVEKTQLGDENNLLEAVKSAISEHGSSDRRFARGMKDMGVSKLKVGLILTGAAALLTTGVLVYKKIQKKKQIKNTEGLLEQRVALSVQNKSPEIFRQFNLR